MRLSASIALTALVLRLIVPAGVMPADVGSGWFLKLCPDNIPAAVAAKLLGHDHHHHHSGAEDATYVQCDLSIGATAIDLGIQTQFFQSADHALPSDDPVESQHLSTPPNLFPPTRAPPNFLI